MRAIFSPGTNDEPSGSVYVNVVIAVPPHVTSLSNVKVTLLTSWPRLLELRVNDSL